MPDEKRVTKGRYIGDCPKCGLVLADFDKELTNGRKCPRCNRQTPDVDLTVRGL
jgi:hypothetical protein